MKNIQRFAVFLLFLICGLLVFVVFSHYSPVFEAKEDITGRVLLAIFFLVTAFVLRHTERFQKYWLIFFAFFSALTAISLDYYLSLSRWILPTLGIISRTPAGLAIEKLESSLLGVIILLVLNRLAGQSLESVYIRRGDIKLGLTIGLIAFALMIAFVIPVTELFFKGKDLDWVHILAWAPWVLIMVISNAAYEELVLRGLLIGKMEPFLGKFATNLVTTIPFVLLHAYTSYVCTQKLSGS
ncbi:MAG: CPBP family glutamic-type intramembrane protease [Chloroflexota bacterium]